MFIQFGNKIVTYNNTIIDFDNIIKIDNPPSSLIKFTDLLTLTDNGDKLYFIIRHGDKAPDESLSTAGIEHSKTVGTDTLAKVEIYPVGNVYAESSVNRTNRTRDTAYYIMQARNDNVYAQTDIPTSPKIHNDVYGGATKIGDWNALERFCKDPNQRQFISKVSNDILVHMLAVGNKALNIFVTHDYVTAPLMSYVSAFSYIPHTTSEYIVKYLNGVAFLKKPNGTLQFYLIDCLHD